ncbi:unnamed protein product [Heligmosomoides polygyrus]|uniref:Homeobox domain-containing protein n=1 Tax=Heligmosomoides polygyrus TaxID=6339 RepID=A0A3P8DF06_HELPZ|nr:unnamed protein product [Heligmosomoides polygyrus]
MFLVTQYPDVAAREQLAARLSLSETRIQNNCIEFFFKPGDELARAKIVKKLEVRWEVLPYPPYSPNLAPSDYYLFRALKQHLRDRCFNDRTELESEVEHFFGSQLTSF